MERIDITLPWPPSSNRYWRYWNKRIIISREAQTYKRHIKALSYTWTRKFIDGRLDVKITVFPPDRRARDLDNLLKITLDSLESVGLFENDSQIDKITIERSTIEKEGKLEIQISNMDKINA